MTTFFRKPRGHRGQGHERMGYHGKVTPQVTLSFPPGGPPTLDPAPTPAKPRGNRNSWPGQVWSHITSMFTSPPTVCWVNPQLVRECPPPPMAHYSTPQHQYTMPPPALNPGGGLWHAAPPGNQQQQMMMEPLQMLQAGDAIGYFPAAKVDPSCFYPVSKTETNGYYPAAKMETDCVFPMAKTDANGFFLVSKVDSNGCYPTAKMEADNFSQTADTHRQTHTTCWPSVDPSTTTSTTTSRPLNPYAREWVPPGYMSTPMPDTDISIPMPLVVGEDMVEMPNHHHSTPIIPYASQDFGEITEEEVEGVQMNAGPLNLPSPPAASTLLLPSGLVTECQSAVEHNQRDSNVNNVALLPPSGMLSKGVSASSEVESTSHSSHSQSPLCYQEESESEREPIESAVMSPAVTNTASPAVVSPSAEKSKGGVPLSPQSSTSPGVSGSVVGPDQEQVCVELPASPSCVKNARPDPTKSNPSTDSSSRSPHQDQQVCVKLPSSSDCVKNAGPYPAQSSLHSNSKSRSPEGHSPAQTSSSASEICFLSPECQASSPIHQENATLEQKCQNLEVDAVLSSEVPVTAKEGLDSADSSSNASVSYARVVERATPSPPPLQPPPEQDRYRGVEQPIPKIFQRDQTPPREAPTPKVEAQRLPELFRRPSKSQRTRTRMFLQELKESSQNGADGGDDGDGGVWCPSSPSSVSSISSISSSSSSSSSSDLSQSLNPPHVPSSPHTIPSSSCSSHTLPSSPSSPVPISPPRCVLPMPRSTPQAIPTSPGTPVSPNGPAESPSRARSESESSVASLDIDFMDEVDRVPSAHSPGTPISISASRRPINRFLACILGSGDSESEDEDDWDDWDEVCVEEDAFAAPDELDDSWETFGLGMVVLQCRPEPVKQCQNGLPMQCQVRSEIQCQCKLPAECKIEPGVQCQNGLPPKCKIDLTIQCRNVVPAECQMEDTRTEDQTDTSYLAEINERWEREVGQGVQGRSAPRVTFGSTKVHPMVVWGHAYREARRGPWEQQARDRARFRQRIGTAEVALSRVLQPSHRTAVYERLYPPDTTATATTPS